MDVNKGQLQSERTHERKRDRLLCGSAGPAPCSTSTSTVLALFLEPGIVDDAIARSERLVNAVGNRLRLVIALQVLLADLVVVQHAAVDAAEEELFANRHV